MALKIRVECEAGTCARCKVDQLNALSRELSSGTTAVVALIHDGRLFVANVGDSRALLCRTDPNGVLTVAQLSADHDLRNEDELLRLAQLGLHIDTLRRGGRLGNQENTRCLGNYLVKGGYKEVGELRAATSEPVIAEPEIHGGIQLDDSCRFLLLMSGGLHKSLQEATGRPTAQLNKEIAHMTVEQFREQATLTGVAQAVVDKVARMHHDTYVSGRLGTAGKRGDITLLVRNFNFPVASQSHLEHFTATDTSDTSTDSSSLIHSIEQSKVDPYVDFSEYYRSVERMRLEGTLPPGIDF
ncbi:TGF-beta-activated kinase 1 and MAP3K7-binding protein 1-like [Bacillus rossius redtenbacheri]|uniref:TGF-beta-activated kinase 1 and MAP3K7-binding protein 1-like n=1 Tax=Bacillus rossius redtenbacheri TaxID=93214 RepID=UPI002FDE694B